MKEVNEKMAEIATKKKEKDKELGKIYGLVLCLTLMADSVIPWLPF